MATFKDDEERLKYLEKNYQKLKHPLFLSSPKAIYDYFEGSLSLRKIENYLSKLDSYTLHRRNKKPRRNYR